MKKSLFAQPSIPSFLLLLVVLWAGPAALAADSPETIDARGELAVVEPAPDDEVFMEGVQASSVNARDLVLTANEHLTRLGQMPVGDGSASRIKQASSCIPPYCCIDNCHDRYLRCEAQCGFGAPLCKWACVLEFQSCEDACFWT